MSTGPIEVAEEAIKKLDEVKNVDSESKDKAEKTVRAPRIRLSDEEKRKIWEEKQAKKPVLETGIKGKVKWYSVRGKYGFIARDDGKSDVFVHQTAISRSPIIRFFLRTLADEEDVEFDIVDGDKGPEAANVTGPEGAEVKGSRFFHVLIHRRNRNSKRNEEKKSPSKDDQPAEGEKKSKRNKRKQHKPREKKDDEGEEKTEVSDRKEGEMKAESETEKQEKPARRRSTNQEKNPEKKKETKPLSPNPKGSGDAALGATSAPPATVQ